MDFAIENTIYQAEVGMTLEEAEVILTEARLKLDADIEYEDNAEVEEGLIIAQKPEAEQMVKKNRKISVK